MKKTFLAFYDVLFVSVISACMYTVSLWIMSWGPLGDLGWHWVIVRRTGDGSVSCGYRLPEFPVMP